MRVLGPFYSGEVLPPILVEQASSLQSKSPILVEQASHPCRASFLKRGGQVWAFVLSGAHAKDGLYLLWACGHGLIGLAKPYLIFYPLQEPIVDTSQKQKHWRKIIGSVCLFLDPLKHTKLT